MRRPPEVFHHTQLPFLGVLIPCIISIIRICMGAKLHNTVSHNDRSRYTRIDPFRERFSITATFFFSLAAYIISISTAPSFVSLAKKKKWREKRKLLNKPRRSISGTAAPRAASLPLIWTFRKRYRVRARDATRKSVCTHNRVFPEPADLYYRWLEPRSRWSFTWNGH